MIIKKNMSLKPFNSFGIDVNADIIYIVNSEEELQNALAIINPKTSTDLMLLGGGSNILLIEDIKIPIIKNEIKGFSIIEENEDHALLKAGAGEPWHDLVLFSLNKNLGGLENLSLIPGSVGASPMQNIGAYGVEIKDVFHSLNAIHIFDRTKRQFNKEECAFGYRESVFKTSLKGQYIITEVIFKLSKRHILKVEYGAIKEELEKNNKLATATIKDVSDAVITIRQSKLPDPKLIGNAGSFFKNPVVDVEKFGVLKTEYPQLIAYPVGENKMKLAAGWLIEQCGWKGYRKIDAGVHSKQALVLVNHANATGLEVVSLSDKIINSVLLKFDVLLEREVNIVPIEADK